MERDSTWPTSPRSSIGCIQNDFQAYDTFDAKRATILHQCQHYLLMRTSLAPIWPCQPLLYQRCNHSIWGLSLMHLMNWYCTMMFVHSHFQNYLHGSREGLIAYGKHGRLMKLIGDQIHVFLMSSTRPPRHFGPKERKSPSPTRFGSWIRTAK